MTQWDATKPVDGPADPLEVRRNWSALEESIAGVNLVADPIPLVWAAGDAAAPTYYTVAGTGATPARVGTGLADTSRQFGPYATKLTTALVSGQVYQTLLSAASWDTGLRSLSIACGAYLKTSTTSTARVYVSDGTDTTYSNYHTGGGTFEWLTVAHTINAAATGPLVVGFDIPASRVGYMQALTCIIGSVPPKRPQLGPWISITDRFEISGAQTTGTIKKRWSMAGFAGLVDDVVLYLGTAPTGQAFIVDVNTWDGAAFTSMFTGGGRPQVAAAANRGYAAPDGTYARRAYLGLHGTSVGAGAELSFDVDQIGSGVAGSDLRVEVRSKYPARPLQALLGVAE